ncbi:unnamed protein product [Coregonus sp. 'balchen']|nr:unnamed protein product [Coregonus sp. 'balchen']
MFQVITRSTPVIRLLAPRGAVLVEAVRGRKTRTDPKAKSKEGRIKTPPPVDPVEMVVLRERFTEYDLIMRALRLEFKEEMLERGMTRRGSLGRGEGEAVKGRAPLP